MKRRTYFIFMLCSLASQGNAMDMSHWFDVLLPDSTSENSFLAAVRDGDLAEVRALIGNHDIDLNERTRAGCMALHWACGARCYYEEIAQLLLEHGADPNVQTNRGSTPLLLAVHYQRASIVKLLLEHGANPNIENENGQTPLYVAARIQSKDMMKCLLEYGANQTIRTSCRDIPFSVIEDVSVKQWFLKACILTGGQAAVHSIQNYWRDFITEDALEIIFKMSKKQLLVSRFWSPADKYIKKGHLNDCDEFGATMLAYAAALGKERVVKYLLQHGADRFRAPCFSMTITGMLKKILNNPLLTKSERACYTRIRHLFSRAGHEFFMVQWMLRGRQALGLLPRNFVTLPPEIAVMIADWSETKPVRVPDELIKKHPALIPQQYGKEHTSLWHALVVSSLVWRSNPLRSLHAQVDNK